MFYIVDINCNLGLVDYFILVNDDVCNLIKFILGKFLICICVVYKIKVKFVFF